MVDFIVKERRTKMKKFSLLFLMFMVAFSLFSDEGYKGNSPLFSSYIAPFERSSYFVDEGYHLIYYEEGAPIKLENEVAGNISFGFKLGKMFAYKTGEFYKLPVVLKSFPDSFVLEAEPFVGVKISISFALFTSDSFITKIEYENRTGLELDLFFVYENNNPIFARIENNNSLLVSYKQPGKGKYFQQKSLKGFKSVRYSKFKLNKKIYSFGGYQSGVDNISDIVATDENVLNGSLNSNLKAVVLDTVLKSSNGEIKIFKKTVQKGDENKLNDLIKGLENKSFKSVFSFNQRILKNIPKLKFKNKDEELLYYDGIYLGRQQFLPAAGQFPYPYYVFSREPKWGWGHEGQVFHESLSMHTISLFDPILAINSQRNFMKVQGKDGYMPYRVGAFFTRTFPVKGEKTTSAPFFSWTNLEVYLAAKRSGLVSKKELLKYLKESYDSGVKFTNYLLRTRDKNKNGLLEWGGHTLLECVRDYLNAVFDLLGKEPDTLNQLEALDLSSMVVKEMRSLSKIAEILGEKDEAVEWKRKADKMASLINKYMWDEKTGFYYHVHKDTMNFKTPSGISLKRKEIIGFLPLWAGIASKEQAKRLIEHLTNKNEFWRKYGVPTLSADDPYYDPQVLSCCRWNGPVWITWVYPVFRGVLDYGYEDVAEKILEKIESAMLYQLKRNHRLWESYSPDYTKLKSPKNYIWDTLISRMIYEMRSKK